MDRMKYVGAIAAGTKVKLSAAGCSEWIDEPCNPHGMTGVVLPVPPITISTYGFVNKVKWDNGNTNSYQAGQLEVVAEEKVAEKQPAIRYTDIPTAAFVDYGWDFPTVPYVHMKRLEGDSAIKLVLGANAEYAKSCNFTKADVAMLIEVLQEINSNLKG